jgi:hypothetical protein
MLRRSPDNRLHAGRLPRRVLAIASLSCTVIAACATTPAPNTPSPSPSPSSEPTFPPLPSFGAAPPTASPTPVPVGSLPIGPVPKGFVPASVTFVSLDTGWVLGSAPCGSTTCVVVLKTLDAGRTWASINPPPTPFMNDAIDDYSAVSEIRFADAMNGWAFEPGLWATHDGGAHWHQIFLPTTTTAGIIDDVETARGIVHASLLGYGNGDTNIETSAIGTDSWRATSIAVTAGAGPEPFGAVVLSGDNGWMVQVDRTVIGGARFEGDRWSTWQPPCESGGGGLYLAAATATSLAAVCTDGQWANFPQRVVVSFSSNAGTSFDLARTQPDIVDSYGAASPMPGEVVIATQGANGNIELIATDNGGATWEKVFGTIFYTFESDLGFTSSSQGVAVLSAGGGGDGELLMTFNSGHTWAPVAFRQA